MGVAEPLGVGVGEPDGVGVGLDVAPTVKFKVQLGLTVSPAASGSIWGTVGATGLVWRILMVVKIAKIAKKAVTETIVKTAKFFFKNCIF